MCNFNDSFLERSQSFIDEEKFYEQQETETLENQQLDLQKQQTMGNLQQNAQKSQQVLTTAQEKVQQKIGAILPVTKEKVNTPQGGGTPQEPQPVEVCNKFQQIEGDYDSDYDNVIRTWKLYERLVRASTGDNVITDTLILQLENVETNASRYTRFKFGCFMKKNSVKYKRYQQIYEMKQFAKTELKELKKRKTKTKGKKLEADLELNQSSMDKVFNSRFLPYKLLLMLTGGISAGIRKLGQKVFALQNVADFHGERGWIVHYGEKYAEFLSGLFQSRKGYKFHYSKAEKVERQAMESETNQYYDDLYEEDEENQLTLAEEQGTKDENIFGEEKRAMLVDTYHTLLNDQKELLKMYKKGKKKNAKAIEQLESQISMKTQAINDFNKTVQAAGEEAKQFVINTTDAYNLHLELNKYRGQ